MRVLWKRSGRVCATCGPVTGWLGRFTRPAGIAGSAAEACIPNASTERFSASAIGSVTCPARRPSTRACRMLTQTIYTIERGEILREPPTGLEGEF